MDQNKKSGVGIQALPNVAIQSFLPFKKLQNKEKLAGTGSPFASWRLCESIILRAEKLKEPYIHFFKKEPSPYLKTKKPICLCRSAFSYKVTKLIPILK